MRKPRRPMTVEETAAAMAAITEKALAKLSPAERERRIKAFERAVRKGGKP